jgi:hypothetical protein
MPLNKNLLINKHHRPQFRLFIMLVTVEVGMDNSRKAVIIDLVIFIYKSIKIYNER